MGMDLAIKLAWIIPSSIHFALLQWLIATLAASLVYANVQAASLTAV